MTQWKWPRFWAPGSRPEGVDEPEADSPPPAEERGGWRALIRKRRTLLVGAAAGVVILVGALLLGLSPLAKARAVEEAARRGFELEVGRVSLGWFRATLEDVTVRPRGVPSVTVRLRSVAVGLDAGLGLREVTVDGGDVEIEGRLDEVREELEAWRSQWRRASTEGAGGGSGGGVEYWARGLGLVWRGAFVDGDEQSFQGLQLERSGEVQQIGLDHLKLAHPSGAVELAGLRALWQRGASGDRLVEASVAEARVSAKFVADSTDAAPRGRAAADTVEGADAARRARAQGAPPPSEDSGLARRLPPLDVERGARWQRLLRHWVAAASERLPEQVKVGSLWLELERGDERLHLGPSTFAVERTESALQLALTPQGATQGTPLAVQATLPRGDGSLRLKIEGGPVRLSTLGVREGDFGLVGVDEAEVGGLLDAELLGDGSTLTLAADAQLTRLALKSQQLAPRPVSIQRSRFKGRAQVEVAGTRYALDEAELQVGDASFRLEGTLERGAEHVAVRLRGGTPLIACQTLLDSAPRGLLDRVEQTKMQGTLALDVGVEYDSRKPADMKVRWDLKNACRITDVPASLAPGRFAMPWLHEVVGQDNAPLVHETGPGTPAWTSIDMMSPHLESAILVCEDGRFFRHDGFDARAIEASIQMNVQAGRFVRGASTVTMQLAKNLYLSREKQLSRKLQEAVLTMLLEQELSKRELLELYFNVVELGPSVYGIRQAAQHYFDTTPDRLTVSQAFFIVSILPSPTRQFFDGEGKLNPGRAAYIRQLLKIAHDRERITDAELEVALTEELRLGVPDTRPDDGEIDSLLLPSPDLHDPDLHGPEHLDPDAPATRTGPPVIPRRAPERAPLPSSRASATTGELPAPADP